MVTLDTDRLTLRPVGKDDIDPLHRLFTEPDVRRYLWDDEVIPRQTASEVVLRSDADWSRHRYGLWTVRRDVDDPLIGFCGFRTADWHPAPELLFGLTRSAWGHGYAHEAASAALCYAFETLESAEVVAATDSPNCASIRLLDRLMTFERQAVWLGLDTLFYRAERPSK